MAKNKIGLKSQDAGKLAENLNILLANFQLQYINTRGFHWNIKGDNFFELHLKFEEIYTDLQIKIDEIAERILTIGSTPFHSFTQFLENSSIPEVTNVSSGKQGLEEILKGLKIIIEKERELLKLSEEAEDEGTNSQMGDYIREQEKLVWMISSYLGK